MNICILDLSNTRRCAIPKDMIENLIDNPEELKEKLKEVILELKESGVSKIKEVNVSLVDFSGSERAYIQEEK